MKVSSHPPRSLRSRIVAVILVSAFLVGSFLLAWHAMFCQWAMSLASDSSVAQIWEKRSALSATCTLLCLLGAVLGGRWGRKSKNLRREP